MQYKYRLVFIVVFLLISLSLSISIINYNVSLNNAHKQLKEHSLPLSLDNIYTEIQKNIVEPYLVSSMMANDTFVHDWILNDEKNKNKITQYLESIKNKYGMFSTFLVSDKTKNYYSQNGFLEVIKEDALKDNWYFDFKNSNTKHQINLDFNKNVSNELIMFINYKIFNNKYQYIGATGVALQVSYIDDMLNKFKQKYNFNVSFFDKNGKIVLAQSEIKKYKNMKNLPSLENYFDEIVSKEPRLIEYEVDGSDKIITTKYIKELGLYISVDIKVNNYIDNVRNIFYFNLLISLIITIIIAIIVFIIIRNSNSKLEYLVQHDTLTGILNRRSFEENLNSLIHLNKRKKIDICTLFIDIDNFKFINDTYGHHTGDIVLKEISSLLRTNLRKSDLLARWGGEEFVIVFVDTTLEKAHIKAKEIKTKLNQNEMISKIVSNTVTASFGLTKLNDDDSIESMISRADNAMYESKKTGKDKITLG